MSFFIQIINLLFVALQVLIFARIIFSFVRVSPYHPTWGPILRFVYETTEPLLAPIRRIMPPMSGLDFSPMILLILAGFVQRLVIGLMIG